MTTIEKSRPMSYAGNPSRKPLNSEDYVPRALPRFLHTPDMIALYIMAVFWVSNVTGVATGGTAAFTYWLLCAITFFIPCALVTAQLGLMFPAEGSIYNWTYKAFGGRFWPFFIGLCAWLPGVLSLVSAADVVVNCLQTLNPHWLVDAWQQGVAIIIITLFCGYAALQRARMVQYMINVAAASAGLIVLLLGIASVVWLLQGHHSATNFADISGWAINLAPQTTNIPLLGTVTLALLGATMPLNMGGEIAAGEERRAITRHLLWGTLLVIFGYLVLTFAVLAVGGQNAAFNAPNPVALLVSTVQTVLGPLAGSITIIGIMLFYVVVGIFENCISARLLMVAGIDQRLPQSMGRLNRFRIPANAIIFQTIIATLYTAVIFFLVPAFTFLGNADTLTVEAYTITAASLLLVWAFSFMFPFLDLGMLYSRYRKDTASREAFLKQLICPLPVLMICIVVGPIVCAATIIVTLISSWIPQLISSNQWWYIVGVVTMILLVFSIIGSMLASSQAAWEDLNG